MTPFIVPGIKSNMKKKVSGLVPLLYMYLIDTKPETFFFNLIVNMVLHEGQKIFELHFLTFMFVLGISDLNTNFKFLSRFYIIFFKND